MKHVALSSVLITACEDNNSTHGILVDGSVFNKLSEKSQSVLIDLLHSKFQALEVRELISGFKNDYIMFMSTDEINKIVSVLAVDEFKSIPYSIIDVPNRSTYKYL
jgi:hypothetical protein